MIDISISNSIGWRAQYWARIFSDRVPAKMHERVVSGARTPAEPNRDDVVWDEIWEVLQ